MNQQNRAEQERAQLSMSALYRQLDDHLGSDEAAYDVETGLERLMDWMKEEVPTAESGDLVGQQKVASMIKLQLIELRLAAMERMSDRRMRSSLIATSAALSFGLLTGAGLLLGALRLSSHAIVPTVAAVAALGAVLITAVLGLHRTTMASMHDDLQLALGAKAERYRVGLQKGWRAHTAEPLVQEKRALETAPRRSGFSLLSFSAFTTFAAVIATWLQPHAWIWASVVAGICILSVVLPLIATVITAVWSGSFERRESALHVLYVLLGVAPRRHPR
jgi:hypothetical protein